MTVGFGYTVEFVDPVHWAACSEAYAGWVRRTQKARDQNGWRLSWEWQSEEFRKIGDTISPTIPHASRINDNEVSDCL